MGKQIKIKQRLYISNEFFETWKNMEISDLLRIEGFWGDIAVI
jgi:hypothetical protein